MNQKIDYTSFVDLLRSFVTDESNNKKNHAPYALFLLGNVKSEDVTTAIGFCQGYLNIEPSSFLMS